MTIKEFSKKYGINAQRVRAAVNLNMPRRNGGQGSAAENKMDFEERDLLDVVYFYLMEDMRSHIELAQHDNELLRTIVDISCSESSK